MKANKLFLLAMGLVAVGCNDSQIEEQSLINDAQGELVEVEIAATIAPASRATSNVGEYEGKTAVDLKFEVEDHIGVYLNNEAVGLTHENTDFKVTSLDGGAATFVPQQDMILLGAGNNVYAYYPFKKTDAGFEGSVSRSSNRGTWDGYHYFEIPAVQQQDTIEVAGEPNPYGNLKEYVTLIAKETQMYKQGNKVKADLVFYHAFGYATMNVQNTYDREMKFVEATVQLLDEAGEPMPIAGDFAAALDNEGNEALLVKASDAEGATSATVVKVNSNDPDGVLTLDPGQSAYITAAVAPVDCRGYEVRLVTDKGFVYKVRKTNLDPAFAVGQGVNRKLSIPVSDATLSSEVVNSEVAEYLLHMDKEHIVLDVAANIELKIDRTSDDAWGGPSTKTITINGGADGLAANRTVSFNIPLVNGEQIDGWNDVDLVNTDATLYIKNLKLQVNNKKSGYSYNNLMFNCKVDLEKVMSLNSITAFRSFTANTLVVYDLKAGNATNNYALWFQPTVEEQVVNINGLQTLNMTAKGMRGIKIDADTNYASFDESALGPQKVVLTLDGNNYFNTTKKAAILVRTKVGADINIAGNIDITNVVDDQENHIWIDEATKSKEDVEKISIKNARWKLEGAAWSAENDATGNLVTAYADNNAGMNEALSYGKNTIELADDTYTLPDMSARQISLSGGAGAIIRVSDNHTNLTDCTLTLKGVTLSSSDPDVNGIKKATALICSGVTVKPIALYGMQAVFVGCTFDLTNGNGDYIYVREANTVNFTNCKFDTKGKAILISNPSEEGNYANKVTVTDCEFYNKGGQPGYSSGSALATQACAAIEISNKHNSGVGAAHTLTTNGNTVAASFSGEWRIKDYQAGNPVTVNGVAYEQIALDGKKMVVTDEGILFE